MKTKFYITLLFGALLLTGCSKSFLDKEPEGSTISADQIAGASELNPELQNANVQGLYTTMVETRTGGTTRDDDFGQRGYDIFTDLLSADMVLSGYNYGWYRGIAEYTDTQNFALNDMYEPWRYYYRLIFGANAVIDGFGGADAQLDDPEARHLLGQALGVRAYAYFFLANLYGEGSYQENSGTPILPIYTSLEQEAQPLSTGAEVYTQILSDLETAGDLLSDFQRDHTNQVDEWVVKGWEAYAYAAMNQYDKVQTITQDIIDNSPYSLLTANQITGGLVYDANGEVVFDPAHFGDAGNESAGYSEGGFNDVKTYSNSWMWGQDLTEDMGLNLVSWWGQIDITTYSYASVGDAKTINYDLYQSIPDNDIRKQQFQTGVPLRDIGGTPTVGLGPDEYAPTGKFYQPSREYQGERFVTVDYFWMRIEEMYLLNAEAAAVNGDYTTARQDLKDLLEIRMPNGTDGDDYVAAITDGDLLDAVYHQERIELWGEGRIYLADKRLHKTVTLGSNHLTYPGDQVSYDESKFSFKIPELEVLNNPNL